MVRKYVCNLRGPYTADAATGAEHRDALRRNRELHDALNACKDQITRHHHGRSWDTAKRSTNEYELVATPLSPSRPSISSYTPISRSFYKLWEMLHDYPDQLCPLEGMARPLRAMFLAEGPGGFVESFARFRALRAAPHAAAGDEMHGMTLMSRNRSVPHWKVQQMDSARAPGASLHVHRGADGTGDLYNVANIDHLVATLGERTCDLVTADGGFDFSGDFNGQEEMSLQLITCEVYAALRLQASRGAFVLKVYDLHTPATLKLLYVLRTCYGGVRLVKPLTSRPANSEKYVLCSSFRGAPPDVLAALRAACVALRSPAAPLSPPPPPAPPATQPSSTQPRRVTFATAPSSPVATAGRDAGRHARTSRTPSSASCRRPAGTPTSVLPSAVVSACLKGVVRMPGAFVCDVVAFNTVYVTRQMCCIARTLSHIVAHETAPDAGGSSGMETEVLREQLRKALRWCHTYGIRASIPALQQYRQRIMGPPS